MKPTVPPQATAPMQHVVSKGVPWRIALYLALSALALSPWGTVAQADPNDVWYDCLTREVFSPGKQAWCDRWQALQNATYTVPTSLDANPDFTTVTLDNGRYQQDDTFFVELVNQQGWMAFGDLDGDGRDDAVVILGVALDPNGQSIATFLTAVLDVDGDAVALTPVKLGERIMLNGAIAIRNNQIQVPVLTATDVTPRAFAISGSALTEVAVAPEETNELTISDFTLPEGTLLLSQTSSYSVRLFVENGQPYLNLYNASKDVVERRNVPVQVSYESGDWVYEAAGDPSVRIRIARDGTQTLTVDGRVLSDYEQVTGTVNYLARIALPPNAVVELDLIDASRADTGSITIASQLILVGDRQVPIPFTLLYDPTKINPQLSYAIQAHIMVDGQLRFISTAYNPVISRGNPQQIEILVSPIQ